jgi:hypothetical protein
VSSAIDATMAPISFDFVRNVISSEQTVPGAVLG